MSRIGFIVRFLAATLRGLQRFYGNMLTPTANTDPQNAP